MKTSTDIIEGEIVHAEPTAIQRARPGSLVADRPGCTLVRGYREGTIRGARVSSPGSGWHCTNDACTCIGMSRMAKDDAGRYHRAADYPEGHTMRGYLV